MEKLIEDYSNMISQGGRIFLKCYSLIVLISLKSEILC